MGNRAFGLSRFSTSGNLRAPYPKLLKKCKLLGYSRCTPFLGQKKIVDLDVVGSSPITRPSPPDAVDGRAARRDAVAVAAAAITPSPATASRARTARRWRPGAG